MLSQSSDSGRIYVCSADVDYGKNQLAALGTASSNLEVVFDISEKSHTDQTQIWITTTNNRIYSKLIFEYEKVN